jgi:hypothetical protein
VDERKNIVGVSCPSGSSQQIYLDTCISLSSYLHYFERAMDKKNRMIKRETRAFNKSNSGIELSFTERNQNVSIKTNQGVIYDSITIEHFIHQPINCGFLFAFCESEYCSENIKFAIAIDKFRDYLASDAVRVMGGMVKTLYFLRSKIKGGCKPNYQQLWQY